MENLREIYPNIDDRIIEDFAKLSTIDLHINQKHKLNMV